MLLFKKTNTNWFVIRAAALCNSLGGENKTSLDKAVWKHFKTFRFSKEFLVKVVRIPETD